MQQIDEIKEYVNKVCEQIRWKKAKDVVAFEIENHICDQRDAYILNGDDEKTAINKAILQMGDAVSVGLELDKTHKPKPQWSMLIITGVLMLIGIFSNYFIDIYYNSQNSFSVITYLFAIAVLLLCYYVDFTILGKHALLCYLVTFILSIIAIMFSSNVAGMLFFIGRFNLEFLSIIYPLVYALFIYKMRRKGYKGIAFCGLAYLAMAFILILISSPSGLILFTISALIILCVSISKGYFDINRKIGLLLVLIPTLIVFSVAMAIIISNDYMLSRLLPIINPYDDTIGNGYIYCIIRDILSKCNFIGRSELPTPAAEDIITKPFFTDDYMITVLINCFGWIILIAIILFILVFSLIGFKKISKQKSILGTLVSLSILITFIMQSISYILQSLSLSFVYSPALPFISNSKTALIINSALIGFMLSIFRTGSSFKNSYKQRYDFSYNK